MYDFLTLNTTKTQEKYKYLPKNIHFIVLHQPKRHKIMLRKLFTANI